MKVLIFGGGGMLGHKLIQVWREKFEVWTTVRGAKNDYARFGIFDEEKTLDNVDVEDCAAIEKIIARIKPDAIINAVGIIKQLDSSKNVIKTLTVNSIFPHRLAEYAEKYNARLICVSTDCVFSGTKGNYVETDTPDAADLYGKSKQLGEVVGENCLTLRTSIIGRELKTAHSLVEWFLSNRGGRVKGFANAIFSGFPTIVLADIISGIIENHPLLNGLYHVSSEPINKYDLLALIKAEYGADIEIERAEDFVIDRSLDSGKFREATKFVPPDWRAMIKRMAADDALYNA